MKNGLLRILDDSAGGGKKEGRGGRRDEEEGGMRRMEGRGGEKNDRGAGESIRYARHFRYARGSVLLGGFNRRNKETKIGTFIVHP